jgi:hypothetical protein
MDDQDLLEALGGERPADAAAENDATGDGGLSDLLSDLDPALADGAAPDAGAEDESSDEALDPEEDPDALKAELAELRQAKRDADARAATAENKTFWQNDRAEVDGKLRQALDFLDQRMQESATPDEVVREYLPRLIAGYTQDLTGHFQKQTGAWEQIARKHGAQTYRQEIQRQYRLTEAAMDEISNEFPPEQWHSAAKFAQRAAAPVAAELTQTRTQLTKAQRAVHATRLNNRIDPGAPGRPSPVSMADALDRITEDKAPQQLMSVLRLSGVA